jgi:signal transduction histidine kinase
LQQSLDQTVKLLLVDDEPRNLDALESILEPSGCVLTRAQTAHDALVAILHNDFAAILLDIKMPGTDGLELAQLIKQRERNQHVPILFLTAYDLDETDILRSYGVGGVDFLSKPINPEILRSKVAVFANLFRTTRALASAVEALDAEIRQRHKAQEQLREFAARLEHVREEERAHVAREIHDDLGQALTILKMDLAWIEKTPLRTNGMRKKIKSMIVDVDQTIKRVRNIISKLRPPILDELGLAAALEWQVSQFQERTGIRGSFEFDTDDLQLSNESSAALFRIVQEALTNVVRHAEASEVRVILETVGGHLHIAIADDGKGVAHDQMDGRQSFGIVGMRERLHRIRGNFKIFSLPGQGTRIEISVPLD